MQGLLRSIFQPQDGSHKAVKDAVVASRERVESAANRFEATIQELLAENDKITGRRGNEPSKHP